MAIKLSKYDIIKGPVISDKAYKLNRVLNQLVLKVHVQANKPQIKDAIEQLFNVRVEEVRTLICKKSKLSSNKKRFNASPSMQEHKKAYVTLKEGYSLNLFDQVGQSPVEEPKKAE